MKSLRKLKVRPPDRLVFWLQLLLVVVHALALLAPYVNPEQTTFFALFNLGFPIIFLLELLFLFYWVARRRLYLLLPLGMLLLSWSPIARTFSFFDWQGDDEVTGQEVKVQTWNVRRFADKDPQTALQMTRLLGSVQPDIICFQEFKSLDLPGRDRMLFLVDSLGMEHHYFDITTVKGRNTFMGVGVVSRWPMINQKTVPFAMDGGNAIVYVDVVAGVDTIRVFSVHLQSIRFRTQVEEEGLIRELGLDSRQHFGSKVERLSGAFVKRAEQVRLVRKLVEESPYPVILCGDFNDTPMSYTHRQVTRPLEDAFLGSGAGWGITFAGPLPLLRIDYIMHSPAFEVTNFEVLERAYSDHYPVVAELVLE